MATFHRSLATFHRCTRVTALIAFHRLFLFSYFAAMPQVCWQVIVVYCHASSSSPVAPCTVASPPYGYASGVLASQVTTCHAPSTCSCHAFQSLLHARFALVWLQRFHHLCHASGSLVVTMSCNWPALVPSSFSSGSACARWENVGLPFWPKGVNIYSTLVGSLALGL
jgi:hypothetical protein